jgi:hypothetical protein
MLTGNYVSIYEIIERVFDTFDSEEIEFSVLVRHIADALLLIGASAQMHDSVEKVIISDYRGSIPSNIVFINQVRDCTTHQALRYTGNSFHSSIGKGNKDKFVESNLTYSLNNFYVFTNFESGIIEMACKVLPVDEKGFPMIPDDIKYKLAVENYILERIAFKLFLRDKMSRDKYEMISNERNWYMAAAQSRGKMPSIDKMETIKNAFTRMLISPMSHSTFFTNVSNAENINIV